MDLPFSEAFLHLLTASSTHQRAGSVVPTHNDESVDLDGPERGIPMFKEFCSIYPEQGAFFSRCLAYLAYRRESVFTTEQTERMELQFFSARLSDLCLSMEFPAITSVSFASDGYQHI